MALKRRRKRTRREVFRPEYSAFRAGAIDFVESAVGLGDELDAVARLATGEANSWSAAIQGSRKELDYFEARNPNASKFITGVGIAAGLFIPGMGVARIAQAGTRAARAAKGAALGSVEGAAYGFASGRDEDRITGAALGAGLGAGLGAASGAFLTKGTPEKPTVRAKDEKPQEVKTTFIGGDDGFVNISKAPESSRPGVEVDTSTTKRKARDVLTLKEYRERKKKAKESGLPEVKGSSTVVGNILLGTRQWIAKNVGERAARLAEDAETMIRADRKAIDELFETSFDDARKLFDDNEVLKNLTLRMNKSITNDRRVSWDQLRKAAKTPEEKAVLLKVEEQVKTLQANDVITATPNYFPTKTTVGRREEDAFSLNSDDYENPIDAIKALAEDVSSARLLARRFGLIDEKTGKLVMEQGGKPVRLPKSDKIQGRMNYVIKLIELKARREARAQFLSQGATKAEASKQAKNVASNLGNGLRSQMIASKKGGDAAGAVARRFTSSALLANPLNAALNVIEGFTAPVYQNGFMPWFQTVAPALVRTVRVALDEIGTTPYLDKVIPKINMNTKKWLGNEKLGLDQNFMGELANTGKRAMSEAGDKVRFMMMPKFVRGSDQVSAALYKLSGVSTVNRMGQEILTNTAIKNGMNLAKKGRPQDLEKLRKHDGMRGLTESEFQSTVEALKKGDLANEWLINFAGASLNKWQPVSASALPKAFHDNPNARMMYSMLTYMNRQMNNIREEIGLNLFKAQRVGLNTAEGSQAAKDAMFNSAKYVAMFGLVAGMWDDARKTLDLSKNKDISDVLTPEGMTSATWNQLWSNISSGAINIRSEQYGGKPLSLVPAPVEAVAQLGSGLFSSGQRLVDGEYRPEAPALRAIRTYAPGFSAVDRIKRMTTGERLFEDYID